MKSLHCLFAACLILLVFSCSPQDQAPASSPSATDRLAALENGLHPATLIAGDTTWNLRERMAHYGVPGVSLAIIHDFEVALVQTYGIMDSTTLEPVTLRTLFQAGSISKPVAAAGALRLVEEGKLSLDENVNTYLTSWQLPENRFTEDKPVALKHLLNHSGGLTVHGFLGYRPGLEVPTLVQVLDGSGPTNSAPIRVDTFPEALFRYSGGGYCVMQQMLIDLEGKSFPAVLKEKILDPLGMTHSTYEQPLPPDQLSAAATGYLPDRTEVTGKRHTYPEMAAAGLWTTAEDLARFALELQLSLQGKSNKVLSREMTERMLTPFVSDRCGLGIFLEDHGGHPYFGHGGWDEGFSSNLVAHKSDGYGVVVLTNANHPAFIDELIRSVARAYDWEGYVEAPHQPLETDSETLRRITGRYRLSADMIARVMAINDRPHLLFLNEGDTTELVRIDENTFVRRRSRERYQFLPHPETGAPHLVILEDPAAEPEFNHPKLADDRRVPLEWVLAGDFDRALTAYRELRRSPEDHALASEGRLNQIGYALLGEGMPDEAILIFRVNTALYPASFNTYDSLGEAYMKKGETERAIANYRRSLELNPDNQNGVDRLRELEEL